MLNLVFLLKSDLCLIVFYFISIFFGNVLYIVLIHLAVSGKILSK
jgi:hypothetical protein